VSEYWVVGLEGCAEGQPECVVQAGTPLAEKRHIMHKAWSGMESRDPTGVRVTTVRTSIKKSSGR